MWPGALSMLAHSPAGPSFIGNSWPGPCDICKAADSPPDFSALWKHLSIGGTVRTFILCRLWRFLIWSLFRARAGRWSGSFCQVFAFVFGVLRSFRIVCLWGCIDFILFHCGNVCGILENFSYNITQKLNKRYTKSNISPKWI